MSLWLLRQMSDKTCVVRKFEGWSFELVYLEYLTDINRICRIWFLVVFQFSFFFISALFEADSIPIFGSCLGRNRSLNRSKPEQVADASAARRRQAYLVLSGVVSVTGWATRSAQNGCRRMMVNAATERQDCRWQVQDSTVEFATVCIDHHLSFIFVIHSYVSSNFRPAPRLAWLGRLVARGRYQRGREVLICFLSGAYSWPFAKMKQQMASWTVEPKFMVSFGSEKWRWQTVLFQDGPDWTQYIRGSSRSWAVRARRRESPVAKHLPMFYYYDSIRNYIIY